MVRKTAEESKRDHVNKMGEALGRQFAELWQEVAHLHAKWLEYVELFGSKPSRIDLLNRAAPAFFRTVQDVFWEDMLLHLSRLTDPPRSGEKRANLTVKNLPDLINDPETRLVVAALVEQLVGKTVFCRDLRNRHIAHRDLELAISEPTNPLNSGSRKQVDEALKVLSSILNVVQAHYEESGTHFRIGRSSHGAVSLLYVLAYGVRAQTRHRERLRRGEMSEDGLPKEV
jgi:hypothetical protein